MTLFEFADEVGVIDVVRIHETTTGKGVFAVRPYPSTAVIGEITGELIRDRSYGSNYAFDLENGLQLEPFEPFRYVNHSCDPNCEFDWIDEVGDDGQRAPRLYLVAYRDIYPEEQLTIDYNWPAGNAVRCDCRSPLCRGWIVSEDELGTVVMRNQEQRQTSRTTHLHNGKTMPTLSKVTPILRIFDEAKAREFYLEYLGFSIGFEHRFENGMPLYMGINRDDVTLHLTEHHGDACPGSAVRIQIDNVTKFHAELESKNYKHLNPGIEDMPWGSREVCLRDPFGNRLVFFEAISSEPQS